jgi:hypothetical protein
MRLLIVFSLIFALCFPAMVMARRDTGPPEWTFDNMTELSDWKDFHDIDPVVAIMKVRDIKGTERNVLKVLSTGDNPYVYPGGSVPNWEPFSGYDFNTIYLAVRVQQSDIWQVDYVTSRDGSFEEGQSQKFKVEARQDFADLEFKMNWESMIRGFRIHFGTTINRFAEIDYLSLRGPVVVTKTPRKLSTTWGRMKDLY